MTKVVGENRIACRGDKGLWSAFPLGRWNSGEMARHYVQLDEEMQARPGSVLLGQLMAM